jgi:hypothetical protein
MMDRLRNGDAFVGHVSEDGALFTAARSAGLPVVSFDILLPEPTFQRFQSRLDAERQRSQYTYGFPNSDGDCNCITWLERLGLPMLTGRMTEFIGLRGIPLLPSRRFGRCV